MYIEISSTLVPNATLIPAYCASTSLLNSRHITIGTTYDNGNNKERQAVSDLTVKTHLEYAEKWGLEHKVVTGNQVKDLCLHPLTEKPVDCVPYWNKIQVLRDWLLEPAKDGVGEEWRVIIDDDMPITSMLIDPSRAI